MEDNCGVNFSKTLLLPNSFMMSIVLRAHMM